MIRTQYQCNLSDGVIPALTNLQNQCQKAGTKRHCRVFHFWGGKRSHILIGLASWLSSGHHSRLHFTVDATVSFLIQLLELTVGIRQVSKWVFSPLMSCSMALLLIFPKCIGGVSIFRNDSFTLNIWCDYINFHWRQSEGVRCCGGWSMWNRTLFWKELLILCPGLKCSWIAEITFCIFSKGTSFASQTTEGIFGSRKQPKEPLAVCLMRHLMLQCDFWLRGINTHFSGHPGEYLGGSRVHMPFLCLFPRKKCSLPWIPKFLL